MAHSQTPSSCGAAPGATGVIATALILLAAYAVLCVWQIDRPIWYDEAWLVDYALQPTVTDALAGTMAYGHPVSIGFLAIVHTAVEPGSNRPWMARVPSLFFGGCTLLCAGWLIGSLLEHRAAGFACVGVLVACPAFQRYALEIKQYMPAAAMILLLVCAASAWCRTGGRAAAYLWLGAAVAGILVAYSAWLMVAASGSIVFFTWAFRRDRRQILRTLLFGTAIMAIAATVYFGFARPLMSTETVGGYWKPYFLPRDATVLSETFRICVDRFAEAWYLYELPRAGLIAAIVVMFVGWAAWLVRERVGALILLVFFALVWVANVAGVWPHAIRVNIGLLVLAHLCVIIGPLLIVKLLLCRRMSGLSAAARRALTCAAPLSCLVLVSVALFASRNVRFETASVDRLFDQLVQQARADDLLLLDTTTFVAQRITGTQLRGQTRRVRWPSKETVLPEYLPLICGASASRVLIPFGHYSPPLANTFGILRDAVEADGQWQTLWPDDDDPVKHVVLLAFTPGRLRTADHEIGNATQAD
jgi:hypothetical protein